MRIVISMMFIVLGNQAGILGNSIAGIFGNSIADVVHMMIVV